MRIKIKDFKTFEYKEKIKLKTIVDEVQPFFKEDIIVAKNHTGLIDFDEVITDDCTIEFFNEKSSIGNKVLERGLIFLFTSSIRSLIKDIKINVKYSIGNGIMLQLDTNIDTQILEDINKIMQSSIETNQLFSKIKMNRIDAIKYFNTIKDYSQAKLLEYIDFKYVDLYKYLNDYVYFDGLLPYSASVLKNYKLYLKSANEVIITKPSVYKESYTLDYTPHFDFYNSITDYEKWGKKLNITNILDINNLVINNKIDELIQLSEYKSSNELFEIAKEIGNTKNLKIILIGGASSSGKTTTTKKLELNLKTLGLKPYMISLDDYYLDKDENKSNDYESVNSLDLELFNKQMKSLLNNEEVILPTYDFKLGSKRFDKRFKLEENSILLVEGLHALNDDLSKDIDNKYKYKIYLSPSTYININNYNRINMTDIRLLRRLVRDFKTRGSSPEETLKMWSDVRIGEEKYVFSFQHNVNKIYTTSLLYELHVLKTYALPLLYSVKNDSVYYYETRRLIGLLKPILSIPADTIPEDSIVREFIGNSIFYK